MDLDQEGVRVVPMTRLRSVEGIPVRGQLDGAEPGVRARSVETDYFNGEAVLLGHLHEVPTPVNRALQRRSEEAARTHRVRRVGEP